MSAAGTPTPTGPPTRTLADLVVPRRPAGVPLADGDDHDARALLTVNGYATGRDALAGLLGSSLAVFQAAAARLLGAENARGAADALARLAHDEAAEETARVQAAFALTRLGVGDGADVLARLLALSPEASPAPLQAAGALARLGDPRGFEAVRSALGSANPVTAVVACKQLYAFVPLDGLAHDSGTARVDAFGAYARALARPEPNVAGEARAQLDALGTPPARALLAAHPAPAR